MVDKILYSPMTREDLHSIKAGDVIERMLAFKIPMYLIVKEVKGDIIDACWTFNKNTGLEIDEDIQRNAPDLQISYIRRVMTPEQLEYLNQGHSEVPFESNLKSTT